MWKPLEAISWPKFCPLLLFCIAGMQASADTQQALYDFNDRLTAIETQIKEEKIYNSPARPEIVRGYNLFLTGDFLYLEAEENGLDFAIKTNDPTFTLPVDYLRYKNLDFDYDIGWRAGFGFNVPHDSWDLYANWTHYNTEVSGHSHAESGEGIFPIWSGLDPFLQQSTFFVTDAHAKLRLNLNMIDAELGREYDVGKHLTLRPSMAIRTGFIEQHYHVRYSPIMLPPNLVGNDNIKFKNEYWGVGPKAQLDTHWTLGGGLGFYGSAAISLLFGEFTLRKNEVFEGLPFPNLKVHHDFHQVRAITDLRVGIEWDFLLSHDQYHFGLRAGYEQHLYFGQNQLDRTVYNDFNSNLVSNLGDLSLQGWSASLRVDF